MVSSTGSLAIFVVFVRSFSVSVSFSFVSSVFVFVITINWPGLGPDDSRTNLTANDPRTAPGRSEIFWQGPLRVVLIPPQWGPAITNYGTAIVKPRGDILLYSVTASF